MIFLTLSNRIYLQKFLANFTYELKSPHRQTEITILEYYLDKYNIKIVSLENKSNYFLLKLTDGRTALLDKVNIPIKVASLQLILNRFKIEAGNYTSIDLRYDKPLLK